MTKCLWCERPFKCRVSGGSAQRFCAAGCRTAFHSAARRWVARAIETGLLSVDNLRDASVSACTLVRRPNEGRVDPDTGAESLRVLRRPPRGNGSAGREIESVPINGKW